MAVVCLQAECDSSGSRVLQRYISYRQFARITNSITRRSGVTDSADSLNLDPREVGEADSVAILFGWIEGPEARNYT